MSTVTVIKPQTAAASLQALVTDMFTSVVLHADGLAGAEEVDIQIAGGAVPVDYAEGGSPVKLTATAPSAELPPGPTYLISKDATAGNCGVYASVAIDPDIG